MEPNFDSKRKLELSDYNKETNSDSGRFLIQKEFDEKLETMKELYDRRIDSITAFAHKFYDVVSNDDVLSAMQGSTVSEKFINQRMRELYEETMLKECEFTIQSLQIEISNQKSSFSRFEIEKLKLQNSVKSLEETVKSEENKNNRLEREIYEYKNKINCMRTEFEDAIKRRDKEIVNKYDEMKNNLFREEMGKREKIAQELENMKNSAEKEKNRCRSLEDDYKRVKKELENCSKYEEQARKSEKISEENENLKEICLKLEESEENLKKQVSGFEKHLKSIISAEQKASNEALFSLQQKYKSRTKVFKKKILDQKQTIESLDQQLKSYKQGLEDYKKNIEKRVIGSQDDLKKVKEEWEKRCSEIALEYQRKEAELQTKQQISLVALQNQYQKILEDKVSEMQKEINTNKAKNREFEFKAYFEEKIKDYVSILEYDEVCRDKERLMKNCEKFTSQVGIFEKELEKLRKERMILEKSIEIERNKVKELEERDDEKKKRAQVEEKLQIVANSLQQYRELLSEKEAEIENINKRSQELRNLVAKLEFELETEKNSSKTLKKDLNQVKQELDLTETAKMELENNIIISKSQIEIEVRRKKNEGIEKYEEELSKHIETKNKLLQAEGKYQQVQRELEEIERKNKDYKENIKNNEYEITKLKKKIIEFDSEINIERISSQDLQKKVEKLSKNNFFRLETSQNVKNKLSAFQSSLKSLKNKVIEEIQELKKDNNSSIQDLLFRFLDNTNYMRKQLETRYQTINDEMNDE